MDLRLEARQLNVSLPAYFLCSHSQRLIQRVPELTPLESEVLKFV